MTNPAVIIVTGLVVAAAAIIAVFASNSARPQAYERRGTRRPTPPSSPILTHYPQRRGKRRKSPVRSSYHPGHELSRDSSESQCIQCRESPFVKILPCHHKSLYKGCFSDYLETNDTCPECGGRIDSCSPTIPPFGKCKGCRLFTKLVKVLPCNHSLSLCIKCCEEQGENYKQCPECKNRIQGYEPMPKTLGICKVCDECTRLALFQPCGHADFCEKHAKQYLNNSDQQCHDCGMTVTRIVC